MNDSNQVPSIEAEGQKVLHSLRMSRIMVPILLGVLAAAFLFYRNFDEEAFRGITWNQAAYFWIAIAAGLLVVRHLFYVWRLRALTRGILSWWKCVQMVFIWEFSAAIMPTSKGGPLIMLFVLTKEKLSPGRAAAAVIYTSVCDAGFFVLTLPVWLLIFGPPMLYPGMQTYSDLQLASGAFFLTYCLIVLYWLFIVFLLFVGPQYARRVMHWIGQLPLLRRWSDKFDRIGEEFELAASEIRQQDWRYHTAVILGTFGAWTSKFIMINCLILALMPDVPLDGYTQTFIYARLVVMFTLMILSPTPGGAGVAELALTSFITDFVPESIGIIVALLWRTMSYYFYLLAGAVIVPAWIASKIKMNK